MLPVNMLDPIWKCFGYGQKRSDFLDCFQFWFSKEGMGHAVQNRPRSDVDGLARVWLNSLGLKASWCAGIMGLVPGRVQPACYLFPIFRFGCVLSQMSPIVVVFIQNQPESDLVLADCARFWPNGSGLCFWLVLPSRSGLDANQIQHVYWA